MEFNLNLTNNYLANIDWEQTMKPGLFHLMNHDKYWEFSNSVTKPFYFLLKPKSSLLSINVQLNSNQDYCLELNYALIDGQRIDQIGVSVNQNEVLKTNQQNSDDLWSNTFFCLKSLIPPSESVKPETKVHFELTANYSLNINEQLFALQLSGQIKENSNLNLVKYIPVGTSLNFEQIKQYWPFQYPSFVWNLNPTKFEFKSKF